MKDWKDHIVCKRENERMEKWEDQMAPLHWGIYLVFALVVLGRLLIKL